MCIPTRTCLTYNNDKPWFTAKLRQPRQAKEDAYRKRDKVLYKQAKYTLEKEIRVTKRNYSGKLRNKISSSDSASVWKGLKDIMNYKTPSPSTVENQQLADYFNDFYCRFGFNTIIPDTLQNKLTQLSVPTSICQWITSFLTNSQQVVRLEKLIQHPHDQHWRSSGLCSLPTALLPVHEWLHI